MSSSRRKTRRFIIRERKWKGDRPEQRGAAPSPAGGDNLPRAPMFPPKAAPSAGAGGKAGRVAESEREIGKAGTADVGVLGGRCSVCCLSAGVRCCAHLRWPTPVRPSPDSRVKGRDFQIFGEGIPKSGAQMQTGKRSLNALRPRATSGARPTGISRRDSLPPLNAMPVVQVLCPNSVPRANGMRSAQGA